MRDGVGLRPATHAWVVFSGETTLWWLRLFLRRGYRHCFVIVGQTVINPIGNRIEIFGIDSAEAFVRLCIRKQMSCAKVGVRDDLPGGVNLSMISCVEVARRIIGLRARVWTPYGLYKRLCKLNREELRQEIEIARQNASRR